MFSGARKFQDFYGSSFTFQAFPDNKLKALGEGTMLLGKKGMSKREQEELRRKVMFISYSL